MASVIGGHALLFMLILAAGSVRSPAVTKPGALTMVSLDAPAPSPPPPPSLPSAIADTQQPLAKPAALTDPSSTTTNPVSGGCAPLELVSKALVADPAALSSIRNAPPESRSIADAVVIWNAGWSPAALTRESPLAPARSVVMKSLAAVDAGCLDTPIAGPRLVPIPNGERTMFLVFGSGNWTWRELAASADAQRPAGDQEKRSILDWDWL